MVVVLNKSHKATITFFFAHCLATSSRSLPKPVLHRGGHSASSFKYQYLLFSLRPLNSCLRLLPPLPVPYTSSSITWFRFQFLSKMWQIQLAIFPFKVCRIFLASSNVCNISSFLKRSIQLSSFPFTAWHFKTFTVFLIDFRMWPFLITLKRYAPNVEFY